MSSLRAAFTQTYNSNSSVCPIYSTIASSLSSCFSKQESKTFSNKSKLFQGTQSMRVQYSLQGNYKKQIQMYLSLNINSLSQLNDKNSSDFSKHDGFIHALQLGEEPSTFWEIQTVKSVQLSHENQNELRDQDPNSTRSESHYQNWGDHSHSFSQVEEFNH